MTGTTVMIAIPVTAITMVAVVATRVLAKGMSTVSATAAMPATIGLRRQNHGKGQHTG
jgi:hypothetical protein